MHGSTVVALHKVLKQQLPVGLHLVGNRLPDFKLAYAIAGKRSVASKTFENWRIELSFNGCRVIGQVEPGEPLPHLQSDRHQAVGHAVEVLIMQYIRRPDQPSI